MLGCSNIGVARLMVSLCVMADGVTGGGFGLEYDHRRKFPLNISNIFLTERVQALAMMVWCLAVALQHKALCRQLDECLSVDHWNMEHLRGPVCLSWISFKTHYVVSRLDALSGTKIDYRPFRQKHSFTHVMISYSPRQIVSYMELSINGGTPNHPQRTGHFNRETNQPKGPPSFQQTRICSNRASIRVAGLRRRSTAARWSPLAWLVHGMIGEGSGMPPSVVN